MHFGPITDTSCCQGRKEDATCEAGHLQQYQLEVSDGVFQEETRCILYSDVPAGTENDFIQGDPNEKFFGKRALLFVCTVLHIPHTTVVTRAGIDSAHTPCAQER